MTLTIEQQKIRANAIGGSEIAAVVDMHPYKSQYDIWADKAGMVGDISPTPPMVLGTHLGPALATAYAELSHLGITNIGDKEETRRHPDKPLAVATPDGLIDADGILECKFPGPRQWSRWGEVGTDQVPVEHFLQVQWTMGVWQRKYAHIIKPGWHGVDVYISDFDPELFDQLYGKAVGFWNEYVIPKQPPPITRASDSHSVAKVYTKDNGNEIEPSQVMDNLVHAYLHTRDRVKSAKEAQDIAAAKIKSLMGENSYCNGDSYRVTWRTNKRGARILRVEEAKK